MDLKNEAEIIHQILTERSRSIIMDPENLVFRFPNGSKKYAKIMHCQISIKRSRSI